MGIARRLRDCRLARGMTQEQAASQAGVTRQTISSYESGRTRPDIDMLVRLAEIYGTDLNGLIYARGGDTAALRRVRAAIAVFALFVLLTVLPAALRLYADCRCVVPEGRVTAEYAAVLAARIRLNEAVGAMDTALLALSCPCFLLLTVLALMAGRAIAARQKLVYCAALAAAMLGAAAAIGAFDPLVEAGSYLTVPAAVTACLAIFLGAEFALSELLRRRRANM